MARTPRRLSYARTAYLKQTLVFYDGPQVVLFQSDRGFPMIAVAVGDPDESNYPLFFTEVTDETMRRYLREKVDLRFLFRSGSKRRYIANWDDLDERGWLKLDRADDIQNDDFFPRHGFWARHHTSEVGEGALAAASLARFAIDGSWDASDFARFYGKFADLYAYVAIAARDAATQLSSPTVESIKEVVRSLGWRGGGSYVGFYDSIFSRVDSIRPLGVNRIAYASPGTIELKGSEEPLAEVANVVENFGSDNGSLKIAYDLVYAILGKEDLRTAGRDKTFSTDGLRDIVKYNCFKLNQGLGVDEPEHLLSLCDNNVVVFSKITLSFYRRARELYAFHAEGRVAGEGVEKIQKIEVGLG